MAKALPANTDSRAEAEALHLMAVSRLAAAARPKLLADGAPWIAAWLGFVGLQLLVLVMTSPRLTPLPGSTNVTPQEESAFVSWSVFRLSWHLWAPV